MSNKYVLIPAAGIGSRMGLNIPKQYCKLSNGKTILDNTLEKFVNSTFFDKVIVAVNEADEFWQDSIYFDHPKVQACIGGVTRFNSVYNALNSINCDDRSWVFVHDAARPCVNIKDVVNLYDLSSASHSQAGILAIKAFETVKKVTAKNIIAKTVNRSDIWLAQTPQLSRFAQLKKAFDFCHSNELIDRVTDEASALELYGINPIVVEGSRKNIKITTQDDLDFASWYFNK